MKKINVAELLKDCPRGMELDCTMYEGVTFVSVDPDYEQFPIKIKTRNGTEISLTKYGEDIKHDDSKCVIFPKGKTSWEGFVPPCQFKSGDVLVSMTGNIVLFSHVDSKNAVHYHCIIPTNGSFRIEENTNIGVGKYYECVLANEQQRQRMYDKIKSSGYKYNKHLNKLEKLLKPKFNVGYIIQDEYGYKVKITEVNIEDKVYGYESVIANGIGSISFEDQNDWKFVTTDKFDITTLKPFDKVLVRLDSDNSWFASFFSHVDNLKSFSCEFVTIAGVSYEQMIPYNEETEHLLGTNNDCPEYYKING